MIAIRKGIPISDCWKCQFVFLIHGGEVSGVPGCTLCVEGAPCSAFVEEKVGPESTESRKGQNTSRGSPGGSGLRRGAWKNKGGYPRKPASKNYPKEGLHLAGMSRQENVLGIGMEVLALTRPPPHQSLSHCPGTRVYKDSPHSMTWQAEQMIQRTELRCPPQTALGSMSGKMDPACPFWSLLPSSLWWRRQRMTQTGRKTAALH